MMLDELTNQAMELYEMLQEEEIDEKTFNDTLEAMGADEQIDSCCKIINQQKADIEEISNEIRRLQARKKVAENGVERMKTALDNFMKSTGQEKKKTALFTVSYRKSETVNVIDMEKLPEQYKKYREPEPNKIAIKSALKDGIEISGVEIVMNKTISIR